MERRVKRKRRITNPVGVTGETPPADPFAHPATPYSTAQRYITNLPVCEAIYLVGMEGVTMCVNLLPKASIPTGSHYVQQGKHLSFVG